MTLLGKNTTSATRQGDREAPIHRSNDAARLLLRSQERCKEQGRPYYTRKVRLPSACIVGAGLTQLSS